MQGIAYAVQREPWLATRTGKLIRSFVVVVGHSPPHARNDGFEGCTSQLNQPARESVIFLTQCRVGNTSFCLPPEPVADRLPDAVAVNVDDPIRLRSSWVRPR